MEKNYASSIDTIFRNSSTLFWNNISNIPSQFTAHPPINFSRENKLQKFFPIRYIPWIKIELLINALILTNQIHSPQ